MTKVGLGNSSLRVWPLSGVSTRHCLKNNRKITQVLKVHVQHLSEGSGHVHCISTMEFVCEVGLSFVEHFKYWLSKLMTVN